jgi:polysaccharide chain length determinant protein (PEP-CTERM system associated)
MNGIYEEIRVALHIVWRRRWLALAIAWAVCVVGWLVISLIPNRYESRARVSVQMNALLPGKTSDPNDAQAGIDRVRQSLTSTANLIKVVRATDLSRQATTDAEAASLAAGLRNGINVVAQPDNFFEISAETNVGGLSDSQNAKLAHDVVQKLIDLFVETNMADDRAQNAQSMTFLNEELNRRQKGLSEAEARKVAFEQKFLGLLPGSGSIDQRMDAARSELASVQSNLDAAQGSLAAVNAQMGSTPATIATPGMSGGGSRMGTLEAQLADAQARGWTDQHPDVVAIRSQMARVRGAGTGIIAGTGSPNPLYVSLRAMQAEKQATAAALASRKAELQGTLNRMAAIQVNQPGVAAQQGQLDRDYQVLKDQYDKLLGDREDVRLRSNVANRADAIQFKVIDPPSRSRIPSSPNRPLLLLGVLIVALCAGVGTAFLQGQLKTSYATADRLAKATGMIVLGSIPETLTVAQIAHRQERLKWFVGAAGALGGAFVLLLAIEFIERGLMA